MSGAAAARGRLRARLAAPGGKLVAYFTFGDPSAEASLAIVRAAAAAGADVIELGVPFSDPSADGPAIQAAMGRALGAGATLGGALATVRRLRDEGCDVPVVLFGYYNPVFVRGVERFAGEAAAAGVDAVLAVDLPVDEAGELAGPLAAAGLDLVPLVAPTSTPARVAAAAALAPPFVYYVSMTGVTGAALGGLEPVAGRVAEVRAAVRCPVAVGFGISTPAQARAVGRFADAVVVGTALVRTVEQSPGREAEAAARLVAELKGALAPA